MTLQIAQLHVGMAVDCSGPLPAPMHRGAAGGPPRCTGAALCVGGLDGGKSRREGGASPCLDVSIGWTCQILHDSVLHKYCDRGAAADPS